jgi:hypothetical protein
MSDEKNYRQRGYQDSDRDRAPKPQGPRPAPQARRISQDGPQNNTRNACALFMPRTTVERETTTALPSGKQQRAESVRRLGSTFS